MKKSRFTEEQIMKALHEWEAGAKPGELCRRLGVTETTLYRWKRKYGGLQVNDARRLRALEEENRRLTRLVADQALNLQVVKDLLGKVVTPEQRRTAVTHTMLTADVSERRVDRAPDVQLRKRCILRKMRHGAPHHGLAAGTPPG